MLPVVFNRRFSEEFQSDGFEFDSADLELLSLFLSSDLADHSADSSSKLEKGYEQHSRSGKKEKVIKVKSNGTIKKASKSSALRVFKKGMTVQEAIRAHGPMPNMSRRCPTNVLVAFPHFDKCDSLVYFPHSYVRLLNSGDVLSTTKLIETHADKDCKVLCKFGSDLYVFTQNVKMYNEILQLSEDLEPDRIMCVHSTKVVENQIRSVVYMKLTDSQLLYNVVCYTLQDPEWKKFTQRAERFKLYSSTQSMDEALRKDVLTHAQAEDDVLLYLRMDLILTFDDRTKKITCIETDYCVTSVHPVVHTGSEMMT